MRTITTLSIILFFLGCQNTKKQSTKMDNTIEVQEVITKMFVNSDNRNWTKVEAQFANKVRRPLNN